jgi:hypothetical protein
MYILVPVKALHNLNPAQTIPRPSVCLAGR